MIRARNPVASRERRKKIIAQASGYWGRSGTCFRLAKRAVDGALTTQYRDRRLLKRNMRRLWIQRISAWAESEGMKYSTLMCAFRKMDCVPINRKMLADVAFGGDEAKTQMRAELMKVAKSVA